MTKSVEEMREHLVKIVEEVPVKEEQNLFGFDLDGIQTGEHLLSQEDKERLISQIQSAQLSKESARRVFAAISGALKLAILVL